MKKSAFPILLFMICAFIISSHSTAQQVEYKNYTIQKGDTLWDISREELNDPFLWPKVWQENPEITNPDRIYPDQIIRIPFPTKQQIISEPVPIRKPERVIKRTPPVPFERREERPAPVVVKPKPPEKKYLISKQDLIISGYIADSVKSVGSINGTPSETSMLTKGDYAYIHTSTPAQKHDKYYIIYPVEKVQHPVTGRHLGTRIAILGTAEVVDEKDSKILITSSFVEIPVGSLLDNFYEMEPPLAVDNPRKPDVNGYVVATLRRVEAHGTWDILFIDKGSNDGMEVGDMLATTIEKDGHKTLNGLIQVIGTKPSTSSAIIRGSKREVHQGDEVIGATQE
jgi:hypothetical protein